MAAGPLEALGKQSCRAAVGWAPLAPSCWESWSEKEGLGVDSVQRGDRWDGEGLREAKLTPGCLP